MGVILWLSTGLTGFVCFPLHHYIQPYNITDVGLTWFIAKYLSLYCHYWPDPILHLVQGSTCRPGAFLCAYYYFNIWRWTTCHCYYDVYCCCLSLKCLGMIEVWGYIFLWAVFWKVLSGCSSFISCPLPGSVCPVIQIGLWLPCGSTSFSQLGSFRPTAKHGENANWCCFVLFWLTQYIEVLAGFCQTDALFVYCGGHRKGRALSKQKLSNWIVNIILQAYSLGGRHVPSVKCHFKRNIFISWAALKSAPLCCNILPLPAPLAASTASMWPFFILCRQWCYQLQSTTEVRVPCVLVDITYHLHQPGRIK